MLFTDVDEYVLEESIVPDDVPSVDSHDDFVTAVKQEQIIHRTSKYTACVYI